jgi:hypothetical protein
MNLKNLLYTILNSSFFRNTDRVFPLGIGTLGNNFTINRLRYWTIEKVIKTGE